MIIPILTQDFD